MIPGAMMWRAKLCRMLHLDSDNYKEFLKNGLGGIGCIICAR